jgi:hypothetical protein
VSSGNPLGIEMRASGLSVPRFGEAEPRLWFLFRSISWRVISQVDTKPADDCATLFDLELRIARDASRAAAACQRMAFFSSVIRHRIRKRRLVSIVRSEKTMPRSQE